MDFLPPGWEDIGAKGLVAIGVLMIMAGWLVPKRTVDREQAALALVIKEQAETIAFQRETVEALTTATQNLAVPAHTSSMALRSIAKSAEAAKGGDE